jgi:aspartate aminotransferase
VLNLLAEIKGLKCNIPQGAFYVFPDITSFFGKSYNGTVVKNSYDMSMYLLNEAHVAVVAGEAFGDNNCIRLSYATSDDKLIEAIKRLKSALEKLN